MSAAIGRAGGRAVLRIHAEIEGNFDDAMAEFQDRYARLARERPNDFIVDERRTDYQRLADTADRLLSPGRPLYGRSSA
ncbi:hypothetical protein [Nocardia sp. CA-145437]|uniref:hypothetical protein n=1 Tax=Nocardia sp. CA-145437 TaxID=3239980 RepID=UPI003D96B6FB